MNLGVFALNITLQIYRAASGQWAGKILVDGAEAAGIAGCDSPGAVELAALELGYDLDTIETI